MGTARGKLGDTVYYRSRGEQRSKTYRRHITNPNTLAQQAKQITFRNGQNFYTADKSILLRFWRGRGRSGSYYNALMSRFQRRGYMVAKNYADDGFFTPPDNYFPPTAQILGTTAYATDIALVSSAHKSSVLFTGLRVGGQAVPTTVAAASEAILAASPYLRPGMSLFLETWWLEQFIDDVFKTDDHLDMYENYGSVHWKRDMIEFVLDTTDTSTIASKYPNLGIHVASVGSSSYELVVYNKLAQTTDGEVGDVYAVMYNYGVVKGNAVVSGITTYKNYFADAIGFHLIADQGKGVPLRHLWMARDHGVYVRDSYGFPTE